MFYLLLLLSLLIPTAHAEQSLALAEQATAPGSASVRDVFVFTSAEDDQRLIAGFTLDSFDTHDIYQLNFDTNRDGIEDRVIQLTLQGPDADHLEATVTEPSSPERTGETIQQVKIGSVTGPVSTHANPVILSERGKSIRAFVGLRDNPVGGSANVGKNTNAFVVDLPLGSILAEHKPDFDFWVSIYKSNSNG